MKESDFMKTFLKRKAGEIKGALKKRVKRFLCCMNNRPVTKLLLISNIVNLIIESLSRHSAVEGLKYLILHILKFEYNSLIIFATLSIALLFSKRNFIITLISLVWITLGVTNSVLLTFRTNPLGGVDFTIFFSALSIVGIYLSSWQIALAVLMTLITVAAIIIMWFKSSSQRVRYVKSISIVAASFAMLWLTTFLSVKAQALPNRYNNIAQAYEDYGFTYCFSSSVIDTGIRQPEAYSEEKMGEIKEALMQNPKTEPSILPNIIFVQLESFFDVNYLNDRSFSENPIPEFTAIKERGLSGFLSVPCVGAGTANTEFEIISGMNLDYFGVGEYPYNTVLKHSTCETIGYNLKELNYSCHAIHNNNGSFYNRNAVFSNLGFDTFTSLEYMQDIERNPIGWAKDKILTDEIIKSLSSTGGRDFVYTISVQGHGKYPETVVDKKQPVKVYGMKDKELKNAFEYYVNQLKETDDFIKELTDTLAGYGEPAIVVFYGDHLPEVGLTEDMLENKNLLQTEYAIWSSFDMEKERTDLEAYQLSAYVLGRLGIDNGFITKLHQNFSGKPGYFEALELLEYDMLYGDMSVYSGIGPHEPANLKMGLYGPEVIGTEREEDGYMSIFGNNFTEYSTVLINGKRTDTEFINRNIIKIPGGDVKNGDIIMAAQVGDDKAILSMSNEYTYSND